MEDIKLSLPLTEVMKIARLTSPLPDVLRLSSSKPGLRRNRRLALLFLTKSNPKFVYSLFRSVAGSPLSSSSSPNFPNYSSPRESASLYVNYLRSNFFVYQRKALRSRARGYLCELRRITCPVKSHLSFCFPFSPLNFLRLPLTSPCPLSLAQTKLPIPC